MNNPDPHKETNLEIQPIVIGTAGHIDHGKSSLVQRLTGTDPDRWKEEKERGMTIDLGFARIELEDGRWVGIVDVPGHERFIRNMVAGASGIDLVILVVAADDGVMPQTREHLSIMGLLGVERGFVALTKVDIVDEEMVMLAEEDVKETVEGTFLEGQPILKVSSITGEGIDELKKLLLQMASDTPPRKSDGVFRMPVQRVFSARGFGTILTGIPVAGSIKIGDVLELMPSGQRGKVRGIQAYHEATEIAIAGHSTAINVTDIDHHVAARGDVVASPGFFKAQRMVGANLTALKTLDRTIKNRMPIRVHTGTAEAVGEVVLLDAEELRPGETGLAQFRMEHDLVCAPGDRFVLRLASPLMTLGGGRILEESRHRLKRFKGFVIEELKRQDDSLGSLTDLIQSFLMRSHAWVQLEDIAVELKRERGEARKLLNELAAENIVLSPGPGERWVHRQVFEADVERVVADITSWFAENALREVIDVRDVRSRVALEPAYLSVVLDSCQEAGSITQEAGGKLRLAGHSAQLDEASAAAKDAVLAALREARFQPPSSADLCERAKCKLKTLDTLMPYLADAGEAVRVGGDLYLAASCVSEAREAIRDNCETNGQLEIPSLRDRLNTTRKYLIPLLEYFDSEGLTLRQGGARVLKRV
ncbi:MAG: selenocysteine-specific elongation factor [Planctomycetota bacterium]|jgi:selenocysteine-specific elongation factor